MPTIYRICSHIFFLNLYEILSLSCTVLAEILSSESQWPLPVGQSSWNA